MTTNLFNQKKLRTGGPWWFIQLWGQIYFQHQIPNFQSLTKNSFPNENVKPIRCTSYGQALFSLPGSKLLTFTNAPDLYTASARFVVAFPLEYSPKVYQSVDRQ